jgi:hypothetical protein
LGEEEEVEVGEGVVVLFAVKEGFGDLCFGKALGSTYKAAIPVYANVCVFGVQGYFMVDSCIQDYIAFLFPQGCLSTSFALIACTCRRIQ